MMWKEKAAELALSIKSNWGRAIFAVVALIGLVVTTQTDVLKIEVDNNANLIKQLELAELERNQLREILIAQQLQLSTQQEQINQEQQVNMELKYTLKNIQDSDNLLKTYMDSVPFAVWIKEADGDKPPVMIALNQAYTAMFGTRAFDYLGKTDFDIHPPELAQQYYENDMAVLESGKGIKKKNPQWTAADSTYQLSVLSGYYPYLTGRLE